MKNFALLYFFIAFVFINACSEEKYTEPIDDDAAPGPVSNVQVESLPGGARITYDLPNDKSLRYVKAVYNIRPDYPRETKSSLYTDEVIVDGFPSTDEYEVTLYAISKGEKQSSPVTVKIRPLESPLQEAFSSLDFAETFGGITVSFTNSGEASLAVTLLVDSSGRMREIETYYTKALEGIHSVRGFEARPTIFGAVIRDRWGNLSDTLTATRTPIFEQLIPKNNFNGVFLQNDTYEPHPQNNHTVDKMWDDRVGPNGGVPVFHTKPGSNMPQSFTFDMGQTTVLSRFKMFHRGPGTQWAYQLGSPKKWEVYGSINPPAPDGSWDGWTKLMDCDSYKPSGDGPVTSEDALYATTTGEDFIFPTGTPPVRYLRFRMLETWGYVDYIYITELTFWGQLQ